MSRRATRKRMRHSQHQLVLFDHFNFQFDLFNLLQLFVQSFEQVTHFVAPVIQLGKGVDVGLIRQSDGSVGIGSIGF